jgi:hypothetical protein
VGGEDGGRDTYKDMIDKAWLCSLPMHMRGIFEVGYVNDGVIWTFAIAPPLQPAHAVPRIRETNSGCPANSTVTTPALRLVVLVLSGGQPPFPISFSLFSQKSTLASVFIVATQSTGTVGSTCKNCEFAMRLCFLGGEICFIYFY